MRTKATARELFKRAFDRMTRKLSLSQKLTAEEKLEYVLKEDKRQRFIADILSIRRSGDYVPDYNKPKKFIDYNLVQIKDFEVIPITGETYTSCERPQDFTGEDGSITNAYGAWFAHIQAEHAKEVEEKHLKELQLLDRENVMNDLQDASIKKMLLVDDYDFPFISNSAI